MLISTRAERCRDGQTFDAEPREPRYGDDEFHEFRLQPYVPGPAFGALFVMGAGRAWLWGVTRQRTGRLVDDDQPPRDFSYAGSIGPWPVRSEWRRALSKLGGDLARRYDLRGLCGVDFIGGGRPWPIEINPRWTASAEILERGTGRSAWHLHEIGCNAADPDEFEARIADDASRPVSNMAGSKSEAERKEKMSPTRWFGKAIWYAARPVPVTDSLLTTFDAIGAHDPWSPIGRTVEIADIPMSGQVIPTAAPVCTVFAAGSTPACVERQLRQTIQSLRRSSC